MWSYSSELLKSFSGLSRSLSNPVWRRLVNWKIASNKPTRRGCRAGSKKVRSIKPIIISWTEGKFYGSENSEQRVSLQYVPSLMLTNIMSLPQRLTRLVPLLCTPILTCYVLQRLGFATIYLIILFKFLIITSYAKTGKIVHIMEFVSSFIKIFNLVI